MRLDRAKGQRKTKARSNCNHWKVVCVWVCFISFPALDAQDSHSQNKGSLLKHNHLHEQGCGE